MSVEVAARNASLENLAALLKEQHARKVDMVVPGKMLSSEEGMIRVTGTEPILTDDGVLTTAGLYRPTKVCDEGISQKLGIPGAYLQRLRAERPDLYDANVNGWLQGRRAKVAWASAPPEGVESVADGEFSPGHPRYRYVKREAVPADPRSFLVRCFRGDDGDGIARAFLSDRYAIVDNLDALVATMEGVSDAGVAVKVDGCDLSERRMRVRIVCEEVRALAPALLEGYRSPFSGDSGAENPTVFAGFVIANSETGCGAWTITPRLVVQVCNNGMTITKDALRGVHLGGRMDDGLIRWAEDTQRKEIELLRAKTRDAVRTFLDTEYMERVIREASEKAGTPIEGKVDEQVRVVTKRLQFSEEQSDAVLARFIQAGQTTAAGVMHAITAAAQDMDDPEHAADMEDAALRGLEIAAAL